MSQLIFHLGKKKPHNLIHGFGPCHLRLDDDELERFLVASNNEHDKFVQLVKKTLRWRERYYFLSPRELVSWSSLVFWHDRDKEQRPILVIRLGQAYSNLAADDRPRFAQAVGTCLFRSFCACSVG